ncbi:MAG: GNAT family N-acetyltransferase, partial [Nocardioides sp.]|uniref:GNAT family N-acetyltransferase n=1 Tax=Nocardioides sp. TaxID=35761 RepID=UPI003F0C4458
MSTPPADAGIDVRPATDAAKYLATDLLVWFEGANSLSERFLEEGIPPDGRFAADLPGGPTDTHAGVYGVRPMTMSVPGGSLVDVGGLTWVGVHPDSRRRGVLSAMLSDHFARTRDAGGALSVLHASEPGIYGRFGYGLACLEHHLTLGRGTTFTAPHLESAVAALTTRLENATSPGVTERVRELALAHAPRHTGTLVGDTGFMGINALNVPEQSWDKEPKRVLFAQRDGVDVGCVWLRREGKWENARPAGTVTAGLLFAAPDARLALLRRLVDLDLTGSVTVESVGVDDPVLDWLPGPRGASDVRTYDSTWVRLVDLGAAWGLREFDSDVDVVVEVADRFAPWNAGRWRLAARGGHGRAERTDDAAEVTLDVSVLGAGYLGRPVGGLLRAGLVAEHRDGAYAELARAMRTD